MSDVVRVGGDDFSGEARHDGSTITATVKGTADFSALDALEKLLTRIHTEASRRGVTETVIDLRQLEFLNSSCFKTFVSWITEIQEMEPERQYRIRILSNPKLHWQKRSLHSLRCFAVELITVVTEEQ